MKKNFFVLFLLFTANIINASLVKIMSREHFNTITQQDRRPVVVKFTWEQCSACQTIKQPFMEIANDQQFDDKIVFAEVDIEKLSDIAQQYNVSGVPAFVYINGGNTVHQEVGISNLDNFKRDITSNINQHLQYKHLPAPQQVEEQLGWFAKMLNSVKKIIETVLNIVSSVFKTIKGLFGK